jgi:hypothetical protein
MFRELRRYTDTSSAVGGRLSTSRNNNHYEDIVIIVDIFVCTGTEV